MEKKEYIRKLKEYTKYHGLSYADYYFIWALMIRTKKQFELPDFELENPFLTSEDYKKLIETPDQRIVEYYGHVMERTVELYEKEETIPREKERTNKQTEQVGTLPREDVKKIIDEKLEQVNRQSVSREEIESVIEEKLNAVDTRIETPTFKVVMTSIGRKIGDVLNGFAVIREEKTGRGHLYHHNANTDTLKGQKTILNNKLRASSGYYVNYEEYVDKMLDEIITKYPSPEEISFVREDGEERSLNELLEEAFAILRKQGSIRFGKDIASTEIATYQDLVNLKLGQTEEFAGENLRVGIYVRRDVLERIFAKYRAKVTILEFPEKQTTK